jgi:hypothetical protein
MAGLTVLLKGALYTHDAIQSKSTESLQKYSQTCVKRSPMGQRKSGLIRQVTA